MNLLIAQARRPPRTLSAGQYGWFALGMFVLAVYGSLIPFRFEPRTWNEVRTAFRHLSLLDPSDLGARGDWILSVVLFTALSYLLMGALCVDCRARVGLAAALLVALQLFVYSRLFDITDILTGTAGVWLGWQAALAWRRYQARVRADAGSFPAGPLRALPWPAAALLLAAWLGAVFYLNWKPFDFVADPARFTSKPEDLPVHGLRRMALLPLVDYYWGSKYQLLDQSLKKTVSFLPLGILLACTLPHLFARAAIWRVMTAALLAAGVVEAGRYFLPSRTPSVTDLLVQGLGTWLGFVLTRHVRMILWVQNALHGY